VNLDELTPSPVTFTPYHKGHTSRNAATLPFVAWDGEGITPEGERRQNYVLFGNSLGYMVSGDKLTTAQCLNLIIDSARENPGAIHVGFSFSYDVEMILTDVPPSVMQILYRKGYCMYGGYRIEYKRGKWFQISRRVGEDKISARIWDVWGFFQCSFVDALRDNLPSISAEDLQRIEDGKAGRSQFGYSDLMSGRMIDYMRAELMYLVQMMTTLRTRLYDADLKIRQWHGPGAIASYAMKKNNMRDAMCLPPEPVNNAAQFAFFGGRFELFQIGYERNPVYAYDIRSAYPSGMALLPNLRTGSWRHFPDGVSQIARFGVYRIVYTNRVVNTVRPHPYPYRNNRHLISYPNIVQGWYWSPEAQMALSIPDARIVEAWVFEDDGTFPFSWIPEVYDRRAQWKREGNPSQMALKLLLNSMFGKTAQRVGWERTGTAPNWHQLEWAGYITSHARAKLFRAMIEAHAEDALLGVETDGIFTRSPLNLEIGEGLGQWESERYDGMIYLQSGFYHKRAGEKWVNKYRGFDKASVNVEDSVRALAQWRPWENSGVLSGTTTRFATMGTWLTSTTDRRNVWSTEARSLVLGGDGKRKHDPEHCRACIDRHSPLERMHDLVVSEPLGGNSVPHHLPWKATTQPNTYRQTISEDEHA
jgi:hypothetical protein